MKTPSPSFVTSQKFYLTSLPNPKNHHRLLLCHIVGGTTSECQTNAFVLASFRKATKMFFWHPGLLWALGCPGLPWAPLGCSGLLWAALGYLGLFGAVQNCFGSALVQIHTWMYWGHMWHQWHLGSPGLLRATLGCSVLFKIDLGMQVCKYTPGCTGGTCGINGTWAPLGCSGLLWATLGCSVLFKSALGMHLCKYTPGCTGGTCGIYGTWAPLGCYPKVLNPKTLNPKTLKP